MATGEKPLHDKVGFLAVTRAAWRLVPKAPKTLRAAVNIALLKPDSKQSIGQLLDLQAKLHPEKDCLLFEGLRWNYRDFNAWANRIAKVLQARGVQSGDTVGLLFDNCPELLACVAATVKLGAVAGMLNPNQSNEVLRHSIGVIKPNLLIIGDDCVATLTTAFPKKPRGAIWLWAGQGQLPSGMESLPDACASADSSVGAGNTGRPTGRKCPEEGTLSYASRWIATPWNQAVSLNNSRPINMRRTSLVPAPIS